jgi:hypothetical protein
VPRRRERHAPERRIAEDDIVEIVVGVEGQLAAHAEVRHVGEEQLDAAIEQNADARVVKIEREVVFVEV